MRIRLTKTFDIEMAHALKDYDGKCRFIHGHTFGLEVTVIGNPLEDNKHPKDGMVMDFGDLKKIVNQYIIDVYDHAFVLNRKSDFVIPQGSEQMFENIIYLDFQPTSERMSAYFADLIQTHLPNNIKLVRLMLRETRTSYAEWLLEDNL